MITELSSFSTRKLQIFCIFPKSVNVMQTCKWNDTWNCFHAWWIISRVSLNASKKSKALLQWVHSIVCSRYEKRTWYLKLNYFVIKFTFAYEFYNLFDINLNILKYILNQSGILWKRIGGFPLQLYYLAKF